MTCEYLATVDVGDKGCRGLAVNQDATVLAVSNVGTAKIATFSLSNGSRMREFGAKGSGPGQLMYPQKLCFSPRTGHILIADKSNKRVQEVTLQGSFVREVIVGEQVYGVAASSELLLVDADTKKLLLFDLHTGTLVRSVGEYGLSPGRIDGAYGFRFTPDGLHIIVAERNTRRLSKFAVNGDFVHCFGMDVVTKPFDVDFSEGGEMLVVDEGSNCVHVFTPDGSTRLKTIGSEGGEPGQFSSPTALTIRGGKLYVLDNNSPRVQSYT